MGKAKTKYTEEFKKEAAKQAQAQGYTQAETAKNLGVDAKNLSRWIKATVEQANPVKIILTAEQEELVQLHKAVKRLKCVYFYLIRTVCYKVY